MIAAVPVEVEEVPVVAETVVPPAQVVPEETIRTHGHL